MMTGTYITPELMTAALWIENSDRSTKDIKWYEKWYSKFSKVSISWDVKADRYRVHWNYNSTEVCTIEQVDTMLELWQHCRKNGANLIIENAEI